MSLEQITLNELSPNQFLREYWQKKPLLIRQALRNFVPPLSPDELAGLACEPGVESRLILEQGGCRPWEVRHGPFAETVFAELPETHWTLLVQEVNRHVPEIADLMERFNFVPAWRLDDVMISYAAPDGSVGPHVDSYDVFLLQAYGERQWQISTPTGGYIEGLELRILEQFVSEQSWNVLPGDMLYLPPNIAHHGIALSECMTISIGFLAPSHRDLLEDYSHWMAQRLFAESDRYTDAELSVPQHPGQLEANALAKIRAVIRQLPQDDASIDQWFGRFVTESRAGTLYEIPDPLYDVKTWLTDFAEYGFLRRAARAVFLSNGNETTLFIEGHAFTLPPILSAIAPLLTEQRDFSYAALQTDLSPPLIALLCEWTNQGWFYFYDW